MKYYHDRLGSRSRWRSGVTSHQCTCGQYVVQIRAGTDSVSSLAFSLDYKDFVCFMCAKSATYPTIVLAASFVSFLASPRTN